MQDRKPNLFTRDDTLLGVCEGLGEDFGINSNLIRLAFAGGLFFNATWAIGIYLGLGVIVALTRWLTTPRRARAGTETEAAPTIAPAATVRADNDADYLLAA